MCYNYLPPPRCQGQKMRKNRRILKTIKARHKKFFFSLYIFRGFCLYVPLPPLRGQHMVLCHPRWLPTSGLTEFAVCWGGPGFEPRTTDLQSGALPYCSQVRYHLKSGALPFAVRCTTICSQVRYHSQSGVLP